MTEHSLFARAHPERVCLEETYRYQQRISRHSEPASGQTRTGQIEVVVPYDGHSYFTRTAIADLERQIVDLPGRRVDALIGYLGLDIPKQLDTSTITALHRRYGTLPLTVPVLDQQLVDIAQLSNDRHACEIRYDYLPQWPGILPIDVSIDVHDEETLWTSMETDEKTLKNLPVDIQKKIKAGSSHQSGFQPFLVFDVRVTLHLPRTNRLKDVAPRIAGLLFTWPTVTSLEGLEILVGGEKRNLIYDPLARTLTWETNAKSDETPEKGEGVMRVAKQESVDVSTFESEPILLQVRQPGELYGQYELGASVRIEIPGCLLSGLDPRLYDAAGGRSANTEIEKRTFLVTDITLKMQDAFKRRARSPYQQLHFDGIIPDLRRIEDIRKTLVDKGFEVSPPEPDRNGHWIFARRQKTGPTPLRLEIYVEGKSYETQRKRQVAGGHTYTTTMESGELNLYVSAVSRGDSERLVQEMNSIHEALRKLFRYVGKIS